MFHCVPGTNHTRDPTGRLVEPGFGTFCSLLRDGEGNHAQQAQAKASNTHTKTRAAGTKVAKYMHPLLQQWLLLAPQL